MIPTAGLAVAAGVGTGRATAVEAVEEDTILKAPAV